VPLIPSGWTSHWYGKLKREYLVTCSWRCAPTRGSLRFFFARAPSPSAAAAPATRGIETVKIATNAFHRSGQLNSKQRELAELQAHAQRRLKSARVNFAEGIEAAKETRRDLDYTQKKLS